MTLYAHADAAFRMGSSHEKSGTPCQDYALAGIAPFAWGIVSDGCSTAGRTDVGARLLALAARTVVMDPFFYDLSLEEAQKRLRHGAVDGLRAASVLLGMDQLGDLDATLGVVVALPNGAAAFLMGDGALAARTDKGIETISISWAGNMPGYPSYLLDSRRYTNFIEASEEAAAQEGRDACIVTREVIAENGDVLQSSQEGLMAREGIMGVAVSWDTPPDILAVTTDGVASFGDTVKQSMVLSALMDFKGREGEFVMRRMRRVSADMLKQDLRPSDDISMAAIACRSDIQ